MTATFRGILARRARQPIKTRLGNRLALAAVALALLSGPS